MVTILRHCPTAGNRGEHGFKRIERRAGRERRVPASFAPDTAVEMGYAAKRARRQAQPKARALVENMEYANIGQFGVRDRGRVPAGGRGTGMGRGCAAHHARGAGAHQIRQPAAGGRIRRRLHSRPDAAGCIHACAGRHWHAHSARWTTAFPTPASDMWAPTVGRAWSSACGIWPDWDIGKSPF